MKRYLKIWPGPFNDVLSGAKTFEIRKDEGYQKNDILILTCWDPAAEAYMTGFAVCIVTHVLRGENIPKDWGCGLDQSTCVMSIKVLSVSIDAPSLRTA